MYTSSAEIPFNTTRQVQKTRLTTKSFVMDKQKSIATHLRAKVNTRSAKSS